MSHDHESTKQQQFSFRRKGLVKEGRWQTATTTTVIPNTVKKTSEAIDLRKKMEKMSPKQSTDMLDFLRENIYTPHNHLSMHSLHQNKPRLYKEPEDFSN